MNDKSMQNQVAVVTGASGGIGSAISRRLVLAGAKIVLGYNSKLVGAQELANTLFGQDHMVIQARVNNSESCQSTADQVAQKFGRLDLLVNCAGITTPVDHNDLNGLTDAWIDRIFQVNWRGAFAMIRAFKPLLEKDGGGTVVNISSIAGFTGVGSNVAYCASKAALDSLSRSLGRALAPSIRVVSVSPGVVLGEYADRLDPAFVQAHLDGTPLERLATPEDVAEAVWAVHTKLTMMTGSIVTVDGGRPLGP